MIEKAINNFLKQFRSKENQHNGKAVNDYKPTMVCVRSTVDCGSHLTDIERKQHVFHEIKKI